MYVEIIVYSFFQGFLAKDSTDTAQTKPKK